MLKAPIINIQKYAIHDGDGIRTTVFFKGCPLGCLWCHNPESRGFAPGLLYNREKCALCLACVAACPWRAVSFDKRENGVRTDAAACDACGACAAACLYGAREIAGRMVTVPELMAEIDKDAAFYEQSGGGVTLSGGEVMAADMDFVEALLRQCRKRGYRVNIDTCGYAPFENFRRVLPYTDVFLYDIKLMDPVKHEQYTGCGNALILENLAKLSHAGAVIYLRLPLVSGVNDSGGDMDDVIRFIKPLHIRRVCLLPYHDLGRHKAKRMGLEAQDCFAPPDGQRLEEIRKKFESLGYETKIGG